LNLPTHSSQPFESPASSRITNHDSSPNKYQIPSLLNSQHAETISRERQREREKSMVVEETHLRK